MNVRIWKDTVVLQRRGPQNLQTTRPRHLQRSFLRVRNERSWVENDIRHFKPDCATEQLVGIIQRRHG